MNAQAQRRTMEEIILALDAEVDYVFCPASSCGTLKGCADYLREHGLRTEIFVADSPGSVIFGGSGGRRLIPGHGAGVRPALYQEGLDGQCIQVSDIESVVGCRRLLSQEALLVGGSSGATLMAVSKAADQMPPGATCVMIFPDRGEHYLDNHLSDEWIADHFQDLLPQDLDQTENEIFSAAVTAGV